MFLTLDRAALEYLYIIAFRLGTTLFREIGFALVSQTVEESLAGGIQMQLKRDDRRPMVLPPAPPPI